MKTYGGVEVQLHPFFTTAVNGNEWSAGRPAALPEVKDSSAPIELATVRSSVGPPRCFGER
jgi:hypothetical protein